MIVRTRNSSYSLEETNRKHEYLISGISGTRYEIPILCMVNFESDIKIGEQLHITALEGTLRGTQWHTSPVIDIQTAPDPVG